MRAIEGHASPAGIIGMLKMCRASVLLVLDLQGVLLADEWQTLLTLIFLQWYHARYSLTTVLILVHDRTAIATSESKT